jgi:stearoyl-CoA desaturase (delta-9 desaturase)
MLVYLLVMTQLTIFTVTLYLHRSQTHRGVDFHPVLAHFFRFWGWLTTGMVTREWVGCIASTTPRWRPRKIRTAR